MFETNPSEEGNLNGFTERKTKWSYNSKKEFIDAVERKCMESDKITEKVVFIFTHKNLKRAKTNLSTNAVNNSDRLDSRSSQQILEDFLGLVIEAISSQ